MQVEFDRYRYERKFLASGHSRRSLEHHIRLNPGVFSSIFHERTVNNLYLDSPALELYFLNVQGSPERAKVRIRWYGELFGELSQSVLEFKIKRGLLGAKQSFPLAPFVLDRRFNAKLLNETLHKSDLPADARHRLVGLEPALVNRYRRKYYRSADKNYRITLDWDLEFFRVRPVQNTFLCQAAKTHFEILELKYDSAKGESAAEMANALPCRVTRLSKYVFGMNCLEGS